MPWFKVDDALATHDKVLAAGNAAMGLWVRAGAWSAQHLTDGRIPAVTVKLLGTTALAKSLVAAGLWEQDGTDYVFHEWHDYQPTREHVEKVRNARREAGRIGGKSRSKSEANPKQVASTLSNPRPVPSRPETVVTQSSQSQTATRGVDDDGLDKIRTITGGTKAHAAKCVEFVLAKASSDIRNPTAYVLAAIREDPAAYKFKRGNPKKDQACGIHVGEWADACRGCAIDRRVGDA